MYWIEVRLLQRNACAARSSTCIAGEHGRIWMTVHRYVQLWRDLHLQEHDNLALKQDAVNVDRKSTRLNSSHGYISYAVFCLKKKTNRPATQWIVESTASVHTTPAGFSTSTSVGTVSASTLQFGSALNVVLIPNTLSAVVNVS